MFRAEQGHIVRHGYGYGLGGRDLPDWLAAVPFPGAWWSYTRHYPWDIGPAALWMLPSFLPIVGATAGLFYGVLMGAMVLGLRARRDAERV